jgi:tetratricopeptide (TPR) repeat protein
MLKVAFKRVGVVALMIGVPLMVVASDDGAAPGSGLPSGLEAYLEARVLEANGRYREAMEAYDLAVDEAPDVFEIRLSYASFLVDLGMAKRAAELLEGRENLGPDGLRVRALALTQMSARQPDLAAQAEAALRAAAEANEADPNLLFALAQILQQQGETDEAEVIVADLRAARPGNPRLTMTHAELLRASGRNEEAVELYNLCVAEGPMASSCRDSLVEVLVELGRPGEAGELMLGWLGDLDLDSLMRAAGFLWEGGRLEASLDTVQRVLARAPDSPRAQILEAHLLSALGRHEEAIDQLRRLLRKSPDDLDLLLAMAWSTGRTGDHEEARKWLDKAWEQAGQDPDSRQAVRCALTAARLELMVSNPIVAREWLVRVGNYQAAGVDFVRLLAETFRQEEQWRDGISALVRIQPMLLNRAQTEAEAIEGEFQLRLGDQRGWKRLRPLLDSQQPSDVLTALQVLQSVELWDDVVREGEAATERFPDNRDILMTRAAALEQLGRIEESVSLFSRLVESDPNDATAANYLGYIWADRDENLDEALELIAKAVTLDPENVAYLDSLGWVHYRLGDFDEAERWLRRAIDFGGDLGDGTIICHLGEVLLVAGELDEGRRYLQIGLDMGCDDPEHVRSLIKLAQNESE